MIHYYDASHLLYTSREKFLKGDLDVYDITLKHLAQGARQTIFTARYNGHSSVFKHGDRNKILIYGTKPSKIHRK